MAITFPIITTSIPMFASLNSLTTNHLESAKFIFNALFIIATLGVWVGVYLEKEKFSKSTQSRGWRLLVYCLGAETLLSGLIWQIDSEISRRQKDEIIALETKIAPRRLNALQCKEIMDSLASFAGRKARVATYVLDAEGSTLGAQIVVCLRAAKIETESGLATIVPMGGFGSGVFVSGSDNELVEAIRASLGSKGALIMSPGPGVFRGNEATGADSPSAKAAFVVVGVKPVEAIVFK